MTSNSASESTEKLLEILKKMDDGNVSVPKELAEILNISLESAYRRLRGEVDFTFSEVVKIAERFGISLDLLIGHKKGTYATVRYNQVYEHLSVFGGYLGNVNDLLKRVRENDGSVTYICHSLPISQSFSRRLIREFKVFYWQRVVLNRDRLKGMRFSADFQLTDPINASIDQMIDHYKHVNRSEIWNENSIDSTIRQINYCKRLGLFEDDKAVETLHGSLIDMLNDLEANLAGPAIENGLKFYLCSIELDNECVQMRIGDQYYTFLSFSVFNSISSSDAGLGEEVNLWKKTLLNKSTQIAGESDLIRHAFFNNLRAKLDILAH